MDNKTEPIWIFFEEGNEENPEFEIHAKNHEEAFDLAYESYGPQVNDLYYKEKTLSEPSSGVEETQEEDQDLLWDEVHDRLAGRPNLTFDDFETIRRDFTITRKNNGNN